MHNRGVAVAGDKVFLGAWDAYLVALDAKTGKRLWRTRAGDYDAGHRFTSPPLIVKDKAIIGFGTMEYPTRGAIDAYDVNTGERLWRFHTIPEPGQPGHESWGGKSWQYGCGPAWLPGTYDPGLDLVYIGIGNPCPMYDGAPRSGDNLYTNAIVALEPDTGKLRWYFQSLPHDVWDYDAVNEPVLVDTAVGGRSVQGLLQAGKNGYFYLLDRTNGQFLRADPFVPRITWTTGLDATGRPAIGNVPGQPPALICPSAFGGTSWNHMAYHPRPAMSTFRPRICVPGWPKPPRPHGMVIRIGADGRLRSMPDRMACWSPWTSPPGRPSGSTNRLIPCLPRC